MPNKKKVKDKGTNTPTKNPCSNLCVDGDLRFSFTGEIGRGGISEAKLAVWPKDFNPDDVGNVKGKKSIEGKSTPAGGGGDGGLGHPNSMCPCNAIC